MTGVMPEQKPVQAVEQCLNKHHSHQVDHYITGHYLFGFVRQSGPGSP